MNWLTVGISIAVLITLAVLILLWFKREVTSRATKFRNRNKYSQQSNWNPSRIRATDWPENELGELVEVQDHSEYPQQSTLNPSCTLGIYQENLDKYRQVFTTLVDKQGYLSQKDKAELKKLQELLKLQDESIALVFQEAEQQEAEKLRQQQQAQRLRQEQEKAEYQAKLHRYQQELSKANLDYPLDEHIRNGLKSFQQSLGLLDEDAARIEQLVLAPKEAEYRRQLEIERLKQQQKAQRQQHLEQELRLRQQQASPSDDLSSEKGIDYTRLRDLLKARQWKEADYETYTVMLKIAGREKEGWLGTESIKNFPCTDLHTIDQLWVKYSAGHFGFSVQKRIWKSVGQDEGLFADAVGWRQGGGRIWGWMNWIGENEVTYDTSAPKGHLPLGWLGWAMAFGGWLGGWGLQVISLLSHPGL